MARVPYVNEFLEIIDSFGDQPFTCTQVYMLAEKEGIVGYKAGRAWNSAIRWLEYHGKVYLWERGKPNVWIKSEYVLLAKNDARRIFKSRWRNHR